MRKSRQLILLAFILLGMFAYVACRKMDDRKRYTATQSSSAAFFRIPDNAPTPMQRVAATIKRQDDQYHFLEKFIEEQGMARWDRSLVMAGQNITAATRGGGGGGGGREDSLVLIPLVKSPFLSVHGFLACIVGKDSVKIRLFDGSTYPAYSFTKGLDTLSAAYVAATVMILNHRVFGDSVYHITDNRLFSHPGFTGNHRNIIINDTEGVGRLGVEITTTYCISIEENLLAFRVGVVVCESVTEWIEFVDPTLPTGTAIPGTGGGGESCGGSWWCVNPCRIAEAIDGSNPCGSDGDDLGWQPVPIDEEDSFNPLVYDEIRIDPVLRDSFPCVAALIEDTLFNMNQIVQRTMFDNFSVGQYNHTYYKVDWNMACNDPSAAVTNNYGTPTTDANGHSHWTDTIRLNPCFLKRASKEAIIGVLLHETIHAYINWCWDKYSKAVPVGSGLVDSFYLQQHFPLHWEYFTNTWQVFFANGNLFSHELMAHNYIWTIASIIYTHGNQSSPAELRRWVALKLAAGGLQFTSAWRQAMDLVDTCAIKEVVFWGMNHHDAGSNPLGYSGGALCNTSYYNFRDSLQLQRADSCQ